MISTGRYIPYILKKDSFSFENVLEFDGVDDYVSFDDTSVYCDANSAWSFNIWVKLLTVGSYPTVLSLKTGIANSPFLVFISNVSPYADMSIGARTNADRWSISAGVDPFLNNWKMLTVTYNGVLSTDVNNYNTYLNGELTPVTPVASAFASISDLSSLNNSSSTDYMHGQLSNFAFWDTELDAAQVATQWNGGNGNFANVNVNPRTVLYLNGDGTDTVAIDDSSNGNNATLNNFPASGMWVEKT